MSDTNGRQTRASSKPSNQHNKASKSQAHHQSRATTQTPEKECVSFVVAVRPNWSEEEATAFVKQYDYDLTTIGEKLEEVLAG